MKFITLIIGPDNGFKQALLEILDKSLIFKSEGFAILKSLIAFETSKDAAVFGRLKLKEEIENDYFNLMFNDNELISHNLIKKSKGKPVSAQVAYPKDKILQTIVIDDMSPVIRGTVDNYDAIMQFAHENGVEVETFVILPDVNLVAENRKAQGYVRESSVDVFNFTKSEMKRLCEISQMDGNHTLAVHDSDMTTAAEEMIKILTLTKPATIKSVLETKPIEA